MTIWVPDLAGRSGPRYIAIAEQLARDLDTGRLKPGDRLPTHRELAWKLGVTVGTVTRAYAEAERRGLIAGEVGRGTFVRDRRSESAPLPQPVPDDDFVDLTRSFPVQERPSPEIARAMAELGQSPSLGQMLGYATTLGLTPHRAAGAEWLAECGLNTTPAEVVITHGGQHAILIALAAVARAGDVVLTEQLTFYGMKSAASLLSLRLHGVAIDEYGLIPDALETACKQTGAKALYCIPTLQNPTTAIMPVERREAIAEICRRHGVLLIEDDIFGFLADGVPPIASFARDNSLYLASLSKSVAPGFRVGYMHAPLALHDKLSSAMRATTWMTAPVVAELATRLVRAGDARRLANAQRDEAIARQKIAARYLQEFDMATHPAAFHAWLTLPEPWRREEFTAQARKRRVGVTPAELFAVGRAPVPHAVRICFTAARDHATLERALGTLAELLREHPDRGMELV